MARNTSRFNKILNFIGLVDEQDDANAGYEQNRPSGAQTYNPSNRRQPPPSGRSQRSPAQDFDDRAFSGAPRYDSTPRYDNAPRYDGSSRYNAQQQDSPRDFDARYTGASRDGGRSAQRDYGRTSPRSDFDTRAQKQPDPRSARASGARNDYYSQRTPQREFEQPVYQSEPQNNVVSLRSDNRPQAQAQTVIYYLHALEECRDVISDLLDNKTVLLNLEDMDERLIQRGIDTLCGAAFALNATLRKASDKTYLIAPNSVNVAQPQGGDRRY